MSYKILVVDDCKDIRELMTLALQPEGYEVAVAKNGRQALQKLNTEILPDLIFVDHEMDELDGPGFLRELEQLHPEILATVPIIMFTGTQSHLVSKNCATEIVEKPLGVNPLRMLVKRYLH